MINSCKLDELCPIEYMRPAPPATASREKIHTMIRIFFFIVNLGRRRSLVPDGRLLLLNNGTEAAVVYSLLFQRTDHRLSW
jgi:hypothetical protein